MTSPSRAVSLWLVAGILVLVTVAVVAVIAFVPPQQQEVAVDGVVTFSVAEPSTVKPDSSFEWRGQPTDPKKIIISELGIDGFIQNVGIDQNNQVAVPTNTHIAGWFVDSVLPGEKGLSIIDGHIDVREGSPPALFQNLQNVTLSDEVTITFGDDSTKRFRVLQVKTVPLDEAADILFSSLPGVERQLNLITCSGSYDETVETFSQRVIVSTELVVE